MAYSADPDQLASVGFFRSQLIWIYTVCEGKAYLGSAGQRLIYQALQCIKSTSHYCDNGPWNCEKSVNFQGSVKTSWLKTMTFWSDISSQPLKKLNAVKISWKKDLSVSRDYNVKSSWKRRLHNFIDFSWTYWDIRFVISNTILRTVRGRTNLSTKNAK